MKVDKGRKKLEKERYTKEKKGEKKKEKFDIHKLQNPYLAVCAGSNCH